MHQQRTIDLERRHKVSTYMYPGTYSNVRMRVNTKQIYNMTESLTFTVRSQL